tara:strand:+ start:183 stop:371 length:189 start_codon:yes stop_codon:yes gene_type:complete
MMHGATLATGRHLVAQGEFLPAMQADGALLTDACGADVRWLVHGASISVSEVSRICRTEEFT